MNALKILIAEDDKGDRLQIRRALTEAAIPFVSTETESIEEALAACETISFDCAIVDYRLPGQDGLSGVTALHHRLPYMAIIMSTGQGDETVASEAIKRGALDYIPKTQIRGRSIKRSLETAVERATLQRKIDRQRAELINFSHVLVHDFKTPAISVQAGANLIQQKVEDGDLARVPDLCTAVIRSVDRMLDLIDSLHKHALAELPVELAEVDMNQVMEDVRLILTATIQCRKACITNNPLPPVHGNSPQLLQLLQNLIANGIKYCHAETPSVQVSAELHSADTWLFKVRDNGIGIRPEDCEVIFEPFKRVGNHHQFAGTGLGLATCRKIVEANGGQIWCESALGQGSRFFFTLPFAKLDTYLPVTSDTDALATS